MSGAYSTADVSCANVPAVGILRALRLNAEADTVPVRAASYTIPSGSAVNELDPAVVAAFGVPTDPLDASVTRTEAMRIPAVRRARMVIAGTIGTLPLLCTMPDPAGGPAPVVEQRPLLDQPDPNTTRQWLLTWTVDDLLFRGISWWRVIAREGQGDGRLGYPTSVERIRPGAVTITDRQALVDGEPVDPRDLIRFDGPDEGILACGATELRICLDLQAATRRLARTDVPTGALQQMPDSAPLKDEEIDALLDSWEKARLTRNTAFLRNVKYETYQLDARQLDLAQLRQLESAEVARLFNLPPRYVNAPSSSGMTYSNVRDERRDLVDTALSPYLTAITQRLTMGDVTPRGRVVSWDLRAFLNGDPVELVDMVTKGLAAQLLDVPEGRGLLGLPPRPTNPQSGA